MDVQGKTERFFAIREKAESVSESTALNRLESFFDEDSFFETEVFVRQRPTESGFVAEAEGVVTGYGSVDGLLCYAFAQDPSVMGGSISEMHAKKICDLIELAAKAEAPIVSFIDCGGIRAGEGMDALQGYASVIAAFTRVAGICPHISVVCGNCTGAFSFVPAIADYTVMLKNASLFLTSPLVAKAVTGKESSGTANDGFASGYVSKVCETEDECFESVRAFLSVIQDEEESDDVNRLLPELNSVLINDNYDVKEVIEAVADNGNVIYVSDGNAQNVVTALIKVGGMAIGVCANQPSVKNGALDSAAAKKLSKFIDFCDSYDLPILTFADTEGFAPDSAENIEDCATLVSAYSNADVPMVTVAIHKAFGSGYVSMCPKSAGADVYLAFTTAEIAPLTPEVGGLLFADGVFDGAPDPVAARNSAIEKYREVASSPLEAAKRGYVDDIIEPMTVRQLIISSFNMFM